MSGTEHAVVIVGAGPAGAAAALRIAARRPDLARRTLVVDRRTFPRDKLCAGGLSSLAEQQLARLGAAPAVPSCRVAAMEFRLGSRRTVVHPESEPVFRTVRRKEFDAALLDLVRSRGVAVRESTRVAAIEQGRDGASVVTEHGELRASAVIGADGANGVVRRALGNGDVERGFALEVHVTVHEAPADTTATFDFAPIEAGLGGYCWIFPAREAGSALLSCGIAVCAPDCAHSGRLARAFLVEWLAKRDIRCDPASICGHPGIAYDPEAQLGAGRVCVAGDAAGVDPYLGEGIPCALGTGIVAADAVVAGLDRDDVDLSRYHEQLRASAIGRVMERRRSQAHARYRRNAFDRYLHAVRWFGRKAASRPTA